MSQSPTIQDGLISDMNIQEYFYHTVRAAVSRQKLEAADETVFYVINLLVDNTRAERLFEQTSDGLSLRPLALIYGDALHAETLEERRRALRRLGDVALLIGGLFSGSLSRKVVDVDYFIAMGGNAYGHLSDLSDSTPRTKALRDTFGELSAKFSAFIDVLWEVSESTHLRSETDLLRLYELWMKTDSPRALRQLRRRGIEPMAGSLSRRHN